VAVLLEDSAHLPHGPGDGAAHGRVDPHVMECARVRSEKAMVRLREAREGPGVGAQRRGLRSAAPAANNRTDGWRSDVRNSAAEDVFVLKMKSTSSPCGIEGH
jgi:hypothetical protein